MNERNLLERTKGAALTFNVFMKASFVPGRLIVNKIKARRFTDGAAHRQRGKASYPEGCRSFRRFPMFVL
jgi:hypothetical protein